MSGDSGLQKFIENNIGKKFGDKYVYGNLILQTEIHDPYKEIDVCLVLPWTTWFVRADYKKIDNHVKFYAWIETVFIPAAEKALRKADK